MKPHEVSAPLTVSELFFSGVKDILNVLLKTDRCCMGF